MPPPGYRKSVRRFKVEQLLSPEHLKEYEALLRDPRMTTVKLHQWILDRGYQVGHAAVGRHRRVFAKEVQAVRRTAMLAEHFADASKGGGLTALSDATVARFQQVLLERLMRLDDAEHPEAERSRDFSPREWLELAKTVSESVSSRRCLEQLRAEFEARARQAAELVEKERPNWQLDGVKVADAVRRILGVPLPDEEMPPEAMRFIELPKPKELPPGERRAPEDEPFPPPGNN
jgi:hypothetical protein